MSSNRAFSPIVLILIDSLTLLLDNVHCISVAWWARGIKVLLIFLNSFTHLLDYVLHGSVALWVGDTLADGNSVLILIDSLKNFPLLDFVPCIGVVRRVGGTLAYSDNAIIDHLTTFYNFP